MMTEFKFLGEESP